MRTQLRLSVCLAFAAALAACTPPGVSTAPMPQARTFQIVVTGSQMTPTNHLVAYQGDTLTITLSADRAEEIHLHGYDRHFHPKPDAPATQAFTADKSGSFEIEIEATSTHLGELEVDPR